MPNVAQLVTTSPVAERVYHVLTLFPDIFEGFLRTSLIHKAMSRGLIEIRLVNIRDFAKPPHFSVDDTPFGGGAGMIMKPEPLAEAIGFAKRVAPDAQVVLLSPAGERFSQQKAQEFSALHSLILVCGRYEGVDQRIIDAYVDQEISIGDYVLMGGEIPAMVLLEASIRLVDRVIGNPDSLQTESFSHPARTLLEGPQYTKPADFQGMRVPDILLSGNHAEIAKWRTNEAIKKTQRLRPDLLENN